MEFSVPYVTRSRFSQTEGVNEAWHFSLRPGIGKDNTTYPYVIVNEWVAANVAQFLQLPIAPFGLFKRRDRRTRMFGSVNFEGDTKPRSIQPEVCWNAQPDLCTGIVVFDALIANADRHRGNIKVDNPADPTQVFVFDHDRALLHVTKGKGVARLRALSGRLGISGGSVSSGNEHCLLAVMNTSKYFRRWLDQVHDMPRSFIEAVCRRADGMGATKTELDEIVDFLDERRRELAEVIRKNTAAFPLVKDWPVVL